MDAELILKVKNALADGRRKFVSVADVLAVIDRESEGVPIFRKTDHLFQDNLAAAAKITGVPAAKLANAAIIQGGPYKGSIAKFRCEPGYWDWAKSLTNRDWLPEERFILSCSFGLGQKMARWLLTGVAPGDWMSIIRQFMGSDRLQIMYVAGDLERLLADSHGDKALAFTRYNAGSKANQSWKAYQDYGLVVAKRAEEIDQQLKENQL